MTTSAPSTRNAVRRAGCLVALLAASGIPKAVEANENLYAHAGGGVQNFMIDVVFWGSGFTNADRADVREYIVNFTRFVNGDISTPGFDPAVRYYGLWGIVPGYWIDSFNPYPADSDFGDCCNLTQNHAVAEIEAAHNGTLGPSRDFAGNVNAAGLPNGRNRLAIVVVKGTNPVTDTNCQNIFNHPCTGSGFHDHNGSYPYAVVMFDSGPSNVVFPGVLSHEIIEAMTDPVPFTGWATNEGFLGTSHSEACDTCGSTNPFGWISSSGRSIGAMANMTLNPSYGGANNIPADTCQLMEPQQYAPMAATYEAGGQGGGSQVLTLVYRTPQGRLNMIGWLPGQSAGLPPTDLGQPSPSVTAEGKPALVYAMTGGGEWIFVRGSDNALWMKHNGPWTSLGGLLFGGPSAAFWNNNANLNVFVLGTDDRLYNYGFHQGTAFGWFFIDNNTDRFFSGPPRVISKSTSTLDLFAVLENGHLFWMPYSNSTGWAVGTDLGSMLDSPHHTPVSITSWGSNRLDIMATSESAVSSRSWSGSWANNYVNRSNLLGSTPSGTPAVVSWGPNRLDAFMIDRQNRLTHAYYDGTWHAEAQNPMRTDAVGDPIVKSRGVNQLDVLYRTTTGSVTRISFNNGWTTEANILPANSIQ